MGLKDQIAQLLKDEIGPALALDGGGIEVVDVANGVVQLRLGGVCTGCPSTVMAVIIGIEQELRQRLPEVEYIEAVP
jgi:Fe-S cluster biogenesis protein NfuA